MSMNSQQVAKMLETMASLNLTPSEREALSQAQAFLQNRDIQYIFQNWIDAHPASRAHEEITWHPPAHTNPGMLPRKEGDMLPVDDNGFFVDPGHSSDIRSHHPY